MNPLKSVATPDFWDCYNALPEHIRKRANVVYEIWRENPRHPSVQFERKGAFWSARVTDDYRALAVLDGETVVWFFIGTHANTIG